MESVSIDRVLAVTAIIATIIVPVLIYWKQKRDAEKKERRDKHLDAVKQLIEEVENRSMQNDTSRCRAIFDEFKELGLSKGNYDQGSLANILKKLRDGRFVNKLTTDKIVDLMKKLSLSEGVSRGDSFRYNSAESIQNGYERPIEKTTDCGIASDLSDLESECIRKVTDKLGEWKKGTGSPIPIDGPVHMLLIGGMRTQVAHGLIHAISCELQKDIVVEYNNESVSSEFATSLSSSFNAAVSIENREYRVTVEANEAKNQICKDKYHIVILTHYYQHRTFNDLPNDLENLNYELSAGGLLVWMSAVSRGTEFEYVCEGFPPMKVIGAKHGKNVDDVGYEVRFTKMDSTNFVGVGNAPMKPMKTTLRYVEWSQDKIMGVQFSEIQPFYDKYFPRSFITDGEMLKDEKNFGTVTAKFLNWYFQWCSQHIPDSITMTVKEVKWLENCSFKAKDDAINRYGDEKYIVCECEVNSKPSNTSKSMNMIAVVGRPYVDGKYEQSNRKTITLHPCILLNTCIHNKGRALGKGVSPSVGTIVLRMLGVPKSGIIKRECANKTHDIRPGRRTCYATVIRMESPSKFPTNNNYLVVNPINTHLVYCAVLPSRRYLTPNGYENMHQFCVNYAQAVENFCEKEGNSFQPYRTTSATILRPYRDIKDLFKQNKIEVDDKDTFFHKCYGQLYKVPNRTLIVPEQIKKSDDESKKKEYREALRNDLKIDYACIRKDLAFNQLQFKARLNNLGSMNVNDVLMFGVKTDNVP